MPTTPLSHRVPPAGLIQHAVAAAADLYPAQKAEHMRQVNWNPELTAQHVEALRDPVTDSVLQHLGGVLKDAMSLRVQELESTFRTFLYPDQNAKSVPQHLKALRDSPPYQLTEAAMDRDLISAATRAPHSEDFDSLESSVKHHNSGLREMTAEQLWFHHNMVDMFCEYYRCPKPARPAILWKPATAHSEAEGYPPRPAERYRPAFDSHGRPIPGGIHLHRFPTISECHTATGNDDLRLAYVMATGERAPEKLNMVKLMELGNILSSITGQEMVRDLRGATVSQVMQFFNAGMLYRQHVLRGVPADRTTTRSLSSSGRSLNSPVDAVQRRLRKPLGTRGSSRPRARQP